MSCEEEEVVLVDPAAVRRESIDAAAYIVDLLLKDGGEFLYRHYLDERLSEFAVRLASEEMLEVVKWHFMSRDEGEGNIASKASWQIDEEPEPAEIDSWARGALQTRKKPVISPPATGASTDKRDSTRARRSRPSTDKEKAGSGEATPQAGRSAVSTAATSQTKKKKEKEEPKGPTAAERHKKLVEEAKAKRAQEQKQEQDQLARLKKEMKDKTYMYDRNGAVVVIEEPDSSKLPPTSVDPKFAIPNMRNSDYTDEMNQLRAVMGATLSGNPGGDAEKARLAALQRQQEQQPPAFETMELAQGVTLVEGSRSKAGPQRQTDANHMSRKDFANHAGGGGGGGVMGSPAPAMANTPAPPADLPPPPAAGADPEPQFADDFSHQSPESGGVPLKDVPQPPKASNRQREEQMGPRLRFPRDRPHVNPTLPTRPIMPDKTSNLASNQDSSVVGHETPASLPALDRKGGVLRNTMGHTDAPTRNKLETVDAKLAKQLLQDR